MKQSIFFLFAAGLLLATGCQRDPYPLELERFDVYWTDVDQSGTRTPNDELEFVVRANSTDPDPDQQFITEWELSYEVNGNFGGIIQGDQGISSNSLNVDAIVGIAFLNFPGPGSFLPGDRLRFTFWAIDNHGTSLQRDYTFVLE
ncbi:MAG: hypothetical protein IPL65_13080 [Lewinellaceae bacterium]|nr:hypothetical protein [Lewinellaceae bacterium]